MGKLTRNQQMFCDEYLIDLNATRAYKAAYKNVTKDETAAAAASRLLRNVKIKAYIDKKMREREKRTEITQDKVLRELARIGFANATDYARIVEEECEVDGEIKIFTSVNLELTENITQDKRAAISEIKQGNNGIEVKLNDKMKALELMGRHLGMFTNKDFEQAQINKLEAQTEKIKGVSDDIEDTSELRRLLLDD